MLHREVAAHIRALLRESDDQIRTVIKEMAAAVEAAQNALALVVGQDVFVSPEQHRQAYRITCRLLLSLEDHMRAFSSIAFRLADAERAYTHLMAEACTEEETAEVSMLACETEAKRNCLMTARRLLARFSERVDREADLQHLGRGSSPKGILRCMAEYIRALNQI